jgi:hypothetical protein
MTHYSIFALFTLLALISVAVTGCGGTTTDWGTGLDITKPIVKITSPLPHDTVSGTDGGIAFSVTFPNSTSLLDVDLYCNGKLIQDQNWDGSFFLKNSGGDFPVNWNSLSNGPNTLVIVVWTSSPDVYSVTSAPDTIIVHN